MSIQWRKRHHSVLLQSPLAGIFTSLWQENCEFLCCETLILPLLSCFLWRMNQISLISTINSFPTPRPLLSKHIYSVYHKALCFSDLINWKVSESQDLASFGLTIVGPGQYLEPKGAECIKWQEAEAWCGPLAAGGITSISCHLDWPSVINQFPFFSVCPWTLSFLFVFICLQILNVYRNG